MKLKHIFFVTGAVSVLFLASCKSTEEPAVKDEVPEEKPSAVETPAEVPADFSDANAKLLEKVEAARNKAAEAEAEKYYPDQFAAADRLYESLKNNVAGDNSRSYAPEAGDLVARYESLANAAQARAMKDKVDEMQFNEVDKIAYKAGEDALNKYNALGPDGNSGDMLAESKVALEAYTAIFNKGFVALAGRERQAALDAKKQADSVKAGVAQKEVYTKASDTFKKADSSYVTKDIVGAYNGYKSSKETYINLYETISAKRAEAQAAIERAKKRVADAESYSIEADSIAPLTEQVNGIENEDAVLLEKDELANPDEAVIHVEEGQTAQEAEKAAEKAIEAENRINSAADAVVNTINNSEAK